MHICSDEDGDDNDNDDHNDDDDEDDDDDDDDDEYDYDVDQQTTPNYLGCHATYYDERTCGEVKRHK